MSARYRPSAYLSAANGAALKVLAELFRLVPTGTPFGGQAVSHEPLGLVWLAIDREKARRVREADGEGVAQAMEIVCRSDPRLEPDRMLRFSGGDWTVAAVSADPARRGWMKLSLERRR